MKFLEQIQKHTPVEWKRLGEVCVNISSGKNIKREENGIYPIYGSTGIIGKTNYPTFNYEQILVARVGTAGYVRIAQGQYDVSDNALIVRNNNSIILKFLYHLLVDMNLNQFAKGAAQPLITATQLKALALPIPPLEIQKEIVRILDTFTRLIAELTAELTARKKQYAYYREQLLTFKEGEVEWKSLGEIGEFIRGNLLQKKDFTETGVGCIHYGQIHTYYNTYTDKTKSFISEEFAKKVRKAKHGNLIIATTSENDKDVCKAVAWLGKKEIAISAGACFYNHSLNPKYVAYFFQTEQFQTQKRPFITGVNIRCVNAKNLEKIKIPIPSLEEQARIVSILDKFDTLTASISEGLPREIELRKKQYAYYREQLLDFPGKKGNE